MVRDQYDYEPTRKCKDCGAIELEECMNEKFGEWYCDECYVPPCETCNDTGRIIEGDQEYDCPECYWRGYDPDAKYDARIDNI